MNITSSNKDKVLTFLIEGELDHHGAKNAMRYIGREIDLNLPRQCNLDMKGISFMDSSGIALILGTYRRMNELDGRMSVVNLPGQARRVLGAAGIQKIVDIQIERWELHMKPINEMFLRFPSRSANEGFARTSAACFAAQLDPTLAEVEDIKTAVSEAVTNCIVHAYPDKLGTIWLHAKIYEQAVFEVVIKDKGCGIEDLEQARKPMFTTGGGDRAGMGFTIMESFMDTLKISSARGRGTTVTMRKKIALRAGGKM